MVVFFFKRAGLVLVYKLDWVGPVDNRHSTNKDGADSLVVSAFRIPNYFKLT